MKFNNRLVIFLTICALAGQGIAPCVVLCRGEEGHIAVESTFDRCCSIPIQTPCDSPASLVSIENEPREGECGPCSDTLISVHPFRMPSQENPAGSHPAIIAHLAPQANALKAKVSPAELSDFGSLSLISVETTILRI